MDRDLSLLPSGGRNAGSRLPSTATVKVIVVCAILLALALAARWQLTGQLKDQQSQLASAEASQQQLKLRSERIRNQLANCRLLAEQADWSWLKASRILAPTGRQ